MNLKYFILRAAVLMALFCLPLLAAGPEPKSGKELKFYDVRKQTMEFMGYYQSIKLTPDQEKIKADALSRMEAPCCKEFTMATCCCPCNLAKSVWGLSNYLVSVQKLPADRVAETVKTWIQFAYENGYTGDACSKDRCNVAFKQDGCGGMNDQNVIF